MKKALLLFVSIFAIFTLAACNNTPECTDSQYLKDNACVDNNAPVINGATDTTVEKNGVFKKLEGVTATDVEDGDLTDSIEVSGSFFNTALGEYTLTYKVTDSHGVTTTVERKVTVVYTDSEAPLVSGLDNTTVRIGLAFDPMSGVSSADTVDGDLTESVTVEGEVNVWVPGEYTLTYTSVDKTGNKFTQKRVVTVDLGKLVFNEQNLSQSAELNDNAELADAETAVDAIAIAQDTTETMVAVTFDAVSDKDTTVMVTLVDGENAALSEGVALTLGTTSTSYTVYMQVTADMTTPVLKFDVADDSAVVAYTNVKVAAAEEKDTVVPEIRATESVLFIPIDSDADLVNAFLLNGVSAADDVDGLLTDQIVITGTVDTSELGIYEVTYTVTDAAGNETTKKRLVLTVELVDTAVLTDPTFDGTSLEEAWGNEGNGGQNVPSIVDGALVFDINDPGQWASHTKMYLAGLGKSTFTEGKTYILKYDAKAEGARKMQIRLGLALGGDPWFADFTSSATEFMLGTEWETYYVVFTADQFEAEGMLGDSDNPEFKIEFNVGTIDWSDEEKNNDVSFDNIYVYEVNERGTNIIQDETFDTFKQEGSVWGYEEGGDASMTVNEDGQLEVAITENPGGWPSNTKIYQTAGNTALEFGHTYRLDITVKATKERRIQVLLGDKLTASPWMDKYTYGENEFTVGTEMMTYSFFFTVDKEGHELTNNDPSFEINMGPISWGDDEKNNVVTFDSIRIVEYVNSGDTVRPEIAGLDKIVVNMNETVDLVTGVTASDNIDGDLTDAINIDDSALDLTTAGSYTIIYTVADAAGNTTTKERKVDVLDPSSPAYIDVFTDGMPEIVADNGGTATSAMVDGVYTVTMGDNSGGWASATKVVLQDQALAADQLYKFTVEVKADVARQAIVRFGENIGAPNWIADYTGSQTQFEIGTEYQTLTFYFYTNQGVAANSFEFQLGTITWGGEETNNTIYIKQFRFDKVEDTEVPVINGNNSNITISMDVPFDPMAGIWASDNVKLASFELLSGSVDQTTAGTYDLVYKATDFVGQTTEITRTVTVVDFSNVASTVNMLDTVDLLLDEDPENNANSSIDNVTVTVDNGAYTVATGSDIGGWASYAKIKFANLQVTQGTTYRFRITLSAEKARNLNLAMGDSLWNDPWFAAFTGSNTVVAVGEDSTTVEVIFTADNSNPDLTNGYYALELMFGPLTWGGEEPNNSVTITEFVLEELASE